MSIAGFTGIERLDAKHPSWADYVAWSGLSQLVEVIGLDQMLCAPLLGLDDVDVWLRRRLSPTAKHRALYGRERTGRGRRAA